MAFLRLIRWKNILLMALTMYTMRFCVIKPILEAMSRKHVRPFQLQLHESDFFLIVMATILVASAGYIINDYFDIRIDSINKPKENIIGTKISRRWAMALHLIFNFTAFIFAIYVSKRIGEYNYGLIFIVTAGILWFYSTTFKRQFLIGNLIVSALTAMIPFMTGLFELPLLNFTYKGLMESLHFNFGTISYWILAFTAFAFASNLLREIIKDAEDIKGDQEYGASTLPIVLGLTKTNWVISTIALIQIMALAYLQWIQFTSKDWISFFYFLVMVQPPLIIILSKSRKAQIKEDFSSMSFWCKIYMTTGVLYSLVIYYSLH